MICQNILRYLFFVLFALAHFLSVFMQLLTVFIKLNYIEYLLYMLLILFTFLL